MGLLSPCRCLALLCEVAGHSPANTEWILRLSCTAPVPTCVGDH